MAFRLELLLQMANKFQNMAVDCEEKLTLAKNTLQAVSNPHSGKLLNMLNQCGRPFSNQCVSLQDMSHLESGEPARCEQELGVYLQDCEALVRQLQQDLQVLRDQKYYQVEQLAFRWVRGRKLKLKYREGKGFTRKRRTQFLFLVEIENKIRHKSVFYKIHKD